VFVASTARFFDEHVAAFDEAFLEDLLSSEEAADEARGIAIRDVPEDVRDALAARARENGQSLQAFLLSLVMREAAFARNLELLKEIESWPSEPGPSPTLEDVLEARDVARAERDAQLGVPPEVVADDYPARRRR
jgi:hypothetical protein